MFFPPFLLQLQSKEVRMKNIEDINKETMEKLENDKQGYSLHLVIGPENLVTLVVL